MAESGWKVFDLEELLQKKSSIEAPYLEFLRVPALSCGVFTLKAGSRDMQNPHDEDEVYYVVSGCARVRVGEEERAVRSGSILYIRATAEHSFFEIEEDMTMLVFFASGGPSDDNE
ncbi:MAG: cupin domain-containing protein [Deltaproteobacteria bacterium]|nr:cupin domain-containing protein [Deltaproteobacteria bacterium]MBW2418792.1 cupin domain-containing protein [Deltaproteobacteria bacterium]